MYCHGADLPVIHLDETSQLYDGCRQIHDDRCTNDVADRTPVFRFLCQTNFSEHFQY